MDALDSLSRKLIILSGAIFLHVRNNLYQLDTSADREAQDIVQSRRLIIVLLVELTRGYNQRLLDPGRQDSGKSGESKRERTKPSLLCL